MPLAIGLALSPFAITTGIVLLLGDRGRLKTAFFALGWLLAICAIAAVALVIVESAAAVDDEATEAGVDIVQLLIAALFLVLALVAWTKRPRGEEPAKSKLLDRLDGLSIFGALGIGVAQGLLVIKNLPLALGAGARFGEAGLTGSTAVVALAVFSVVASLGVLVPLGFAVVAGPRLAPALGATRTWIEANMTAITIVILLILGGYFLGQGVGILG
ncbi:GAP family protein [Leucobacter tenebrionis]|uniref:GAP family protein n=1 Tax=Leucobacter tenebrionis TaxID=2873270 RepID=UPI001CA6D820|nr:GAP family protein [Leucobacter tenebrionis]QZY51347.1 GAP family protein [Leucobacter tenebrionis]